MSETPAAAVAPATTTNVAHIVGSINRDIVAFVRQLPRPGETVLGSRGAMFPGGKGANQAVAIARLGGNCRMVGRVGADAFGTEMTAFLTAEGVDATGIGVATGVATGIALITVDNSGENCITVVPGANLAWPQELPSLNLTPGDIVVCQLEVPLAVVLSSFSQARASGALTVLNPAPYQQLPDELLALTDTLVLNETELAAMAGLSAPVDPADVAAMRVQVARVVERGPKLAIVTLGEAGVHVQARGANAVRIAGHRVTARDATGAGDCFVGALVSELLHGADAMSAATFANAAAALSVTCEGAASSYPNRTEVEALVQRASRSV